MGVVAPKNTEVLDLKGLHLYHSGISNCSMRVRIVLEEKGLDWESHHLNILVKEHITPEYFGINPNGLVPTLVHDGVVIIESDDIIDYIDDAFPDPPLKPAGESDREQMYYWLRKAVEIHVKAVKTYIYYKRVGKNMAHDAEEDEKYRNLQTNPELLDFHRKSTTTGFTDEDVGKAKGILDDCFKTLDNQLSESEWIAGNEFSLADVAWMPLHFTLDKLAGYSFEPYANLGDWAHRISQRDSFQKAVLDWWPAHMGGKN